MLRWGKSASVTFNRPGTYSYACLPHSFMIGQVFVTGAAIESAPPTVVEKNVTPAASPVQSNNFVPDMPNMPMPANNPH